MALENEKDNELFEEQPQVEMETSDRPELLDEVLAEEPKTTPKSAKREKKPFDPRRLKAGSIATALTVIVVAAIILLNVVVGLVEKKFPMTLDTSAIGLYTLSDEAEAFVKGIDKEVTITVCMPESELSSPQIGIEEFDNTYKQLHAALADFTRLSNGKVTVKYIDLASDPTAAAELAKLGADDGDILFTCGELTRVTTLAEDYTNYGITELQSYYQYYYSLPTITSMVENTLAVNIHAVTADKDTTVTILTGHKEESPTVSVLESLLKQQGYRVEQVNITTAATFAADSRMAVIPAPAEDYTDAEITALRTWLQNGDKYERHLLYFPSMACSTPKLDTFVEDTYGVKISGDVVFQPNAANRPQVSNSYAYYFSYATTAASDFTAAGTRVMNAMNRVLYKSDKAAGQLSTLYAFPEGTQMQSVLDEKAEPVDTTDTNAIGAILAYNVSNQCESYAAVFGGTMMLQYFDSMPENEALVTAVVNGILGNEGAAELPGKTVTDNTLFNVETMSAAYTLFVIFAILLPVATLVVCLLVFLKRRHL